MGSRLEDERVALFCFFLVIVKKVWVRSHVAQYSLDHCSHLQHGSHLDMVFDNVSSI